MELNTGVKLEIRNFSKRYGKNKDFAVKDASLTVFGGEIFGFLGPNGAGKSTTIKSVVGIQTITEGSILICGYDVEKQPVEAKRLIGYVPDHYALYEKLTAREYVNYIADIYGVSREERLERIPYYVNLFHLQDSFDSQIKTFSHGMKQKVTIIAALIHEPKLWLLDEPLTGLDPDSIYQVKECMRLHAAKGNIVMFSSHIIDVVENLCQRVAVIKKGYLMQPLTIDEIHKDGTLEEYYLKMAVIESPTLSPAAEKPSQG
ncbi:MAG: ABC transporter ATP-binding protein [Bacilli bacterium]